jgi:cytochrome P450
MEQPRDPIAAVTHPDPYPYYAALAASRPFAHHPALGLWVAASAEAVAAVLADPACGVRPPAELIPAHLVGTPLAAHYGHLIRMNDRADRCPLRGALVAALGTVGSAQVAARSTAAARRLARELAVTSVAALDPFIWHLPVAVVGGLLGIPDARLAQVARWVGDFVACLAPGSDPARVQRGTAAAEGLTAALDAALDADQGDGAGGLLATFRAEAVSRGLTGRAALVANAIGLLMQSYEATAGLIGNTLVALAARPELARAALASDARCRAIVAEVLRHDPPIQNTRRFLLRDATVAGQRLAAGSGILVVLAAANRDPACDPQPERFDPERGARANFTLGHGAHACPGGDIAVTIATAAVTALLGVGLDLAPLRGAVAYRTSVNARIPQFSAWARGETPDYSVGQSVRSER